MVLDSGKRQYDIVREMYHGTQNDVVVCRDLQAAGNSYKTVWLIKDRKTARKIIEAFELNQKAASKLYEECFLYNEQMCFVFPYEKERSIEKFYLSAIESHTCSRRQIWTQIVTACMTCGLPDTVLYLLIKQRQLQMGADGSIWFQYCLDFSEYDENVRTPECVTECAGLLEQLSRLEKGKNYAGELFEKKIKRKSYTEFIGLYKDVRLITAEQEKKYTKKTITDEIQKRKDMLYHILFTVSLILFLIVVVMFLFHITLGDFSFYRLFRQPIEQIGTESLLQ